MSYNLVTRYSLKRLGSIAAVTAVGAAIAWGVDFPRIAWGAVAALPVAMFNYLLVYRAVHKTEDDKSAAQAEILKSVLVRLVIALLALWIASRFGVEVMLGALMALVAEMISYMGDTVRLILSLRGEK